MFLLLKKLMEHLSIGGPEYKTHKVFTGSVYEACELNIAHPALLFTPAESSLKQDGSRQEIRLLAIHSSKYEKGEELFIDNILLLDDLAHYLYNYNTYTAEGNTYTINQDTSAIRFVPEKAPQGFSVFSVHFYVDFSGPV